MALTLAAALAASVAAVALGPGLLRRAVVERARARGVALEVARVLPGSRGLRLEGVDATVVGVPGVTARFEGVELRLGLDLRPRGVVVRGGKVVARGEPQVLRAELSGALQRPPAASGTPEQRAQGLELDLAGIDVLVETPGAGGSAAITGLTVGRDSRGTRLGAERATLARGALRVDAEGLALELAAGPDGPALAGAAVRSLRVLVDLGRPAEGAGDGGEAAPAGAALAATERLREATAAVAERLLPGRPVTLGGVHFTLRRDDATLGVGPAVLSAERTARAVVLGLRAGEGGGRAALALRADLPLGPGEVVVSVAGGPLPLGALGVTEGDPGLVDVGRTALDVDGTARLAADGSRVQLSGRTELRGLSFRAAKLAPAVVRDVTLTASGDVSLSPSGDSVDVARLELGVGRIRGVGSGTLRRSEGHAVVDAEAKVPLTACADALSSLPPAVVPLLSGLRVGGTFSASARLVLDTRRPGDARVELGGTFDCRPEEVPAALSASRFRQPFLRSVDGADGLPTTVESGPGTEGWVGLDEMSPHLATAVVVCEDSRFRSHGGVDLRAVEDAIRDDLRAGRFARGASTVTMQLAKNLYLTRDKTLSRKLQEVVLAALLERSFTKDELLELYLNVVELGPGVYGVGPAARHYFGTTPRHLSLAESLYLASLLPNPARSHFRADGTLEPGWAAHVRRLAIIAGKIRRATDAEVAAAAVEELRLGVSSAGAPTGGGAPAPGAAAAPELDGEPPPPGADAEEPAGP